MVEFLGNLCVRSDRLGGCMQRYHSLKCHWVQDRAALANFQRTGLAAKHSILTLAECCFCRAHMEASSNRWSNSWQWESWSLFGRLLKFHREAPHLDFIASWYSRREHRHSITWTWMYCFGRAQSGSSWDYSSWRELWEFCMQRLHWLSSLIYLVLKVSSCCWCLNTANLETLPSWTKCCCCQNWESLG